MCQEIIFEEGDAESLPYDNARFDAMTILIGADKVARYPLMFAKRSADLKGILLHDLGNSPDRLLACVDSLLEEP